MKQLKLAALKHRISPEIQDRLPEGPLRLHSREYLNDRKKLEESSKSQSSHQYTSGLFNESNKGYDDLRYHNGRAHESQPNKFTATNRGKDINWEKKYY